MRTRFPPEPSGHLHLGHAKALHLSHALARENGGSFHLRFDDTNPETERSEHVEGIKRDVRWLGADWDGGALFASDHFERLHALALRLIRAGKAYVDDLPAHEISRLRGTLERGGEDSPFRGRPVRENLDLFARMGAGEFPDGSRCLRAKIDMKAPNVTMRDPVLYRIRSAPHHRTGTRWRIYPTYDFTHPLSDSIEGITHSLCTLEFEDHRPLYDWLCRTLDVHHPRQIEFARLNLDHTVMGKRHLARLVDGGLVGGWDDPRLPTIAGMRRRGYTPSSIRAFCERVGVTKKETSIGPAALEACVREELDASAPRRLAVLDPVRVTVEDWEGDDVDIEVPNHPLDPSLGTRTVTFGRELFIERADFAEDPPKGYRRLAPGRGVRLKYAFILEHAGHSKDADGRVTGISCRLVRGSLGGRVPEGAAKPKGIVGWVHAGRAADAEVRLYGPLLSVPRARADSLEDDLAPDSLRVARAKVEPRLAGAAVGEAFQFERQGYFRVDEDSREGRPVLNRTVELKDPWARRAALASKTL